jgi:hypothetical protein
LFCIALTALVTDASTGSRLTTQLVSPAQLSHRNNRASNFHRPVSHLDLFGLFLLLSLESDNWEKAAQLTNLAILPAAATRAEQSSKIRP